MHSCVCFDQMPVEHMYYEINHYFLNERNYWLKIFKLQTFILNQLEYLVNVFISNQVVKGVTLKMV